MIERTEEEIEDVLDQALNVTAEEGTKWPGMHYEQGVIYALDWVLGNMDESPMDE